MEQTPIANSGQQKCGKGLKIITAIALIVAAGGIGFGVYGMIQSTKKDTQISDLKVQIKDSEGNMTVVEPSKIETTTDDGKTVTIVDTPKLSEEELSHYIYVAQWNIKIKLPTELHNVSYQYYMEPGYTSLGVSGVDCSEEGICQYGPEFIMSTSGNNHTPLAAVYRYLKGTECKILSAQKITTIGDYDYYVEAANGFHTTNQNEIEWEAKTRNLIENTLSNPDNYSAI